MYNPKDHINRINGQQKAFGDFARQNAFYISGAGTDDQYSGIKGNFHDGGDGLTIVKRVDKMIDYLYTYLQFIDNNYTGKDRSNQKININLDVVGFSRGAASARMFVTKVNSLMERGIWYHFGQTAAGDHVKQESTNWKYTKDWLLKNCNIKSELFKSNFSNDNDGYFLWIGGYKVYIKYLHKLQNLYFELEGTELEVNI